MLPECYKYVYSWYLRFCCEVYFCKSNSEKCLKLTFFWRIPNSYLRKSQPKFLAGLLKTDPSLSLIVVLQCHRNGMSKFRTTINIVSRRLILKFEFGKVSKLTIFGVKLNEVLLYSQIVT